MCLNNKNKRICVAERAFQPSFPFHGFQPMCNSNWMLKNHATRCQNTGTKSYELCMRWCRSTQCKCQHKWFQEVLFLDIVSNYSFISVLELWLVINLCSPKEKYCLPEFTWYVLSNNFIKLVLRHAYLFFTADTGFLVTRIMFRLPKHWSLNTPSWRILMAQVM